jgi:hypothetical protein
MARPIAEGGAGRLSVTTIVTVAEIPVAPDGGRSLRGLRVCDDGGAAAGLPGGERDGPGRESRECQQSSEQAARGSRTVVRHRPTVRLVPEPSPATGVAFR